MIRDEKTIIVGRRLDFGEGMRVQDGILVAARAKGYKDIVLSFLDCDTIFPDGILPIVTLSDALKAENVDFQVLAPGEGRLRELCDRMGWFSHIDPTRWIPVDPGLMAISTPLIRFDSFEQLNEHINSILNRLMKVAEVQTGVIKAFEWTLNEIADNVLNHSERTYGWIQVQYHPKQKIFLFLVADSGIGIPRSMSKAFEFRNDTEGINMALMKGVTSKPEYGQGNGLAGTLNIVKSNEGVLMVASGNACIRYEGNRVRLFDHEFRNPFAGTIIEFRLRTDRSIDVPMTLDLSGREFGADYLELRYENDDGFFTIELSKEEKNFGNRKTAMKLRRFVRNVLREKNRPIVLDFGGIGIVSSSFADELLGKLFLELGATQYSTFIRINNVNSEVARIIDASVSQRLEGYLNK